MAIQIIEEKPGFASRLGAGVAKGLSENRPGQAFVEAMQEGRQKKQQAEQLEAENEAAKRFGIDLTGIMDPKMRQTAVQEALSAKSKESESLRKQDFLNRLMSGNSEQETQMESLPTEEQTPNEIPQKKSSLPYSKGQILSASLENPPLARAMVEENKAAEKQALEMRRERIEEQKIQRKEALQFHKDTEKIDQKISNEHDAAEKKLKAIKNQRRIQPQITTLDRYVSGILRDTRFENLFKSKSAQEFDAMALPMVEGQKETFGVRLSDADLRLILQKIATSDKNPEANKAILDYMELEERLKIDRRKIADQIKKENKNLRPIDFEDRIRERLNAKHGDQIQNAANTIMNLDDNQKKFEMVTGRTKVTPGTPVTDDVIERYLDLSKDDWKKAEQMALEDGYQF